MGFPEGVRKSPKVFASSLTPCQRKTEWNFRVATDFRVAQLLKHPTPCEFHSLAEYYHALLLEGDPVVSRYVPQPFLLTIGRRQRRYAPDCYVVRDGQVDVVELRPRAEFDEQRRQALEAFFQCHRMRFIVLANEAVVSRQCEALNWQKIVQLLVLHQHLDTSSVERDLLDDILHQGTVRLSHYVQRRDRASSRSKEIALLRLLHKGKVLADLANNQLNYDTELKPCG
ncbi:MULTISPECIES: hypothetical protein [Marinobacter]|uniref:hypothetical protein n=1 Tax=Marinobacter TaxID=2742 RepID=UPI001B1D37B2|nr:hypothetical protein [Marinobacter sp.]MBO6812114.1 hypothetical protein [Marinobacter sp.]MBO6873638.1 hypothetical protein [Marinobacter sp.]